MYSQLAIDLDDSAHHDVIREDSHVPDLEGHHMSVHLRTYSRSPVFIWGVRSCLGGHAVHVGSVRSASDRPVVAVIDAMTALEALDATSERVGADGFETEQSPTVVIGVPSSMSMLPATLTRRSHGLLSEAFTITELRDAVAAAALGNSYIQRPFDSALLPPTNADPWSHLTDREIQVLKAITCGESDDRIARLLGISRRTVRFHVANIFTKLNVRSRCSAAVLAATADPRP